MRTVNMHEAKTHLSRLVKAAVDGEPFVIAISGKPMVRVTAVTVPEAKAKRRVGFMSGQIEVPDDFDRMYSKEIATLFEGEDGGQ
ncbi:MAG: type II toxin-antitoxin system prevent-host-death family antitoxin [Gammaproteobacteria bacterium]|nr:type II toxin-antitoxin system prevent-host-death family antitoxin [Gammaproteobacteria bacterium]